MSGQVKAGKGLELLKYSSKDSDLTQCRRQHGRRRSRLAAARSDRARHARLVHCRRRGTAAAGLDVSQQHGEERHNKQDNYSTSRRWVTL